MMILTVAALTMAQARQSLFVHTVSVPAPVERQWTSEVIESPLPWREAIVSWNVANDSDATLRIEAQAVYPDRETKWYTIAEWSGSMKNGRRGSVTKQEDADGDVQTDVLVVNEPAHKLRLRTSLDVMRPSSTPKIKHLVVCFSNPQRLSIEPENTKQEIKELPVPRRSQMSYEGGKLAPVEDLASLEFKAWLAKVKTAQYCSPTATSMLMAYWAKRTRQPALDRDVQDVIHGVFDKNWPGTGNWPFNTAYMGSFEGMVSYVTRLERLEDLESLLSHGVPVAVSVSYNLLQDNGKKPGGDGHIVVLVGFTESGDPIFNDPGRSREIRQVYKREAFRRAWAVSRNTLYVAHPSNHPMPKGIPGILP